ncbi:hypothetical protein BDI4_710003 [Burkholderia diffusa]|nr:hypothetical protein BDI4_710003 [Burkholderia diffusa]
MGSASGWETFAGSDVMDTRACHRQVARAGRGARAPGNREAEAVCPWAKVRSDLDHLEVFLASAAFGARPVDRDVFPARARGDALFGQPGFFVINPATNQAHPALVFHLKPRRGKVGKFGSHDGTVSGPDCLAIALESDDYVALR